METKPLKLNIGSGRKKFDGFINLDINQNIGSNGVKMVDIIIDIEKEKLPFEDNSVEEILVDAVLEHLGDGFIFFLNECHRVLKPNGIISGEVPLANTNGALRDVTHKRVFVRESFSYLCGVNEANPAQPSHPRYANYGIKPWYLLYLECCGSIHFKMQPRKTIEVDNKIITVQI